MPNSNQDRTRIDDVVRLLDGVWARTGGSAQDASLEEKLARHARRRRQEEHIAIATAAPAADIEEPKVRTDGLGSAGDTIAQTIYTKLTSRSPTVRWRGAFMEIDADVPSDGSGHEYDVGLSFAGEDRAFVEKVAEGLRRRKVRVFYDRYEEVDMWGKNLITHLDEVYRLKCRFCVLFVSVNYARKVWTNHERESAQTRAILQKDDYLLPARFDDTSIPGLLPTIGYFDLRSMTPELLVEKIMQKLGSPPATSSGNVMPPATSADQADDGLAEKWRLTADSTHAWPLSQITTTAMPGRWGTMDERPFLRLGMAIGCDPLADDAISPPIWRKLRSLLAGDAVKDFLSGATYVGEGTTWEREPGDGSLRLEGVYRGPHDARPVASAMLLPAFRDLRQYGRADDMTCLWLQVEPRTEAGIPASAGLAEWRDRFRFALDLAAVFAEWLTDELGLRTRSAPPARLAILLKAPTSMSELVDSGSLRSLGQPGPQFVRYAVADSIGKPGDDCAGDLLTQLCDSAMRLEDFDSELAQLL